MNEKSDGHPQELNEAFNSVTNGAANTSASQAATTTPFSQSTLPSKSLLSREESNRQEPSQMEDGGPLTVTTSSRSVDLPKSTHKSLQSVIRRIFERCFKEGLFRQVVGIAVEAKNLETLRETVLRAGGKEKSGKREELMDYLLGLCMNVVQERGLRNEILQLVLDLLLSDKVYSPDYFAIAKCMVYLGQTTMAANLLKQLVEQDNSNALATAYQVSFDLYDNGSQDFLQKVVEELPRTAEEKSEFENANGSATQPSANSESTETEPLLSQADGAQSLPNVSTMASRPKQATMSEEQRKAYGSITDILEGSKSIELNLEFLFRSNKTDRQTLTKLKNSLEARNSIFHSAVTFANAFMNSGTTDDWFIRENLDWLGKAVNWSKFSVTASLGVIHRGNIGQGQKLLEPYLRISASGQGSSYQRGGALFAMGLIYTNHGKHVSDYLFNQLKQAANDETAQHGAALGLGVAGMASHSEDIVDELKQALFSDSAISGQAVGLAIGLVMLGSGNVKALSDMITYCHETEHDKTVRGLALGMALIMYGRQEAADELINGLLDDPDPTIRYGCIWSIALAYCGTSSNKAVRKLLHVAVSDVNDDVRRTAVMSLGFVLFRKPSSVPRMVELLSESYNPHVRYGATMALGIACAGTGLKEAVELLEPMMKDSTDFVRQGAYIALAMIMIQQSEAMSARTVTFRKQLMKTIGDRHEDAMAKFGAAIALGVIDAGGRNCTIGLQTQTGNLNMTAVVGMAIFTQYWYWFPLTHFMSLTFVPTTVIGIDHDLEIPNFKLHCAARPSMFDYPPTMEVKTEEAPEKVKAAVLSTTAQTRRRRQAREKQQNQDSMDLDKSVTTPKPVEDDKMDTDDVPPKEGAEKDAAEKDSPAKSVKAKLEKEKVGYEIDNMSRVLPSQLRYISFPSGRYSPVKNVSLISCTAVHFIC